MVVGPGRCAILSRPEPPALPPPPPPPAAEFEKDGRRFWMADHACTGSLMTDSYIAKADSPEAKAACDSQPCSWPRFETNRYCMACNGNSPVVCIAGDAAKAQKCMGTIEGKQTPMVACATLPHGAPDGACFQTIQGAPLKFKDYNYWLITQAKCQNLGERRACPAGPGCCTRRSHRVPTRAAAQPHVACAPAPPCVPACRGRLQVHRLCAAAVRAHLRFALLPRGLRHKLQGGQCANWHAEPVPALPVHGAPARVRVPARELAGPAVCRVLQRAGHGRLGAGPRVRRPVQALSHQAW